MFGGSGFIGQALSRHLLAQGHTLRQFVRLPPSYIEEQGHISWDPYRGELSERYLEGCDTVINLCGENISEGRWTADYRRQLIDSRVVTTDLISRRLAGMAHPPHLLLNASAVGIYGLRDIHVQLTESSPPGTGFLAEMCQKWEAATSIAEWGGIRVIHMRFGVVLGGGGGMLAKLVPLFKANLGGRLGHGQQAVSWIALDDLLAAVDELMSNPTLSKAVNLTAPNPVTNAELTHELANALGRKAVLAVPATALLLIFGEMARETVLGGQAALPKKLLDAGFEFRLADLGAALKQAIYGGQ